MWKQQKRELFVSVTSAPEYRVSRTIYYRFFRKHISAHEMKSLNMGKLHAIEQSTEFEMLFLDPNHWIEIVHFGSQAHIQQDESNDGRFDVRIESLFLPAYVLEGLAPLHIYCSRQFGSILFHLINRIVFCFFGS